MQGEPFRVDRVQRPWRSAAYCLPRVASFFLALVACGGGGVSDGSTGPGGVPGDSTPGGTVQRGSLAVQVSFAPEDAPLASAASVSTAGVAVNIQRKGSTEAARTAVGEVLLMNGVDHVEPHPVIPRLARQAHATLKLDGAQGVEAVLRFACR